MLLSSACCLAVGYFPTGDEYFWYTGRIGQNPVDAAIVRTLTGGNQSPAQSQLGMHSDE